ncbi:MAG: dihydropteroate synthase [Bacteroidales bacterium]|nr:dihydropteroate synthase [Bacteroidales bacterium]
MPAKQIRIRGRIVSTEIPLIMGIINISADSFYAGSRVLNESELLKKAEIMLRDGADILDIGAVSTRPGALLPDKTEEMTLLQPVLSTLQAHFSDAILSVDTVHSDVARMAVADYDVAMVNDISGGQIDAEMFKTIAGLKVPYVLMHMKGKPENMQQNTDYLDLKAEVFHYFSEKINQLHLLGVADIIVDPGFGFAKNLAQNYELMASLDEFQIFEKPVLVGVSRKSMIWKLLECSPEDALNGTSVLHTIAIAKGADILRVHDVKEAREVVKIMQELKIGINNKR